MPGNEDEAAGLLDAYLERATADIARAATVAAWTDPRRLRDSACDG